MKIAVDFHSTLANLTDAWLGHMNRECGTKYAPTDVTAWRVWDVLPELTERDFWRYLAMCSNADLTPEPGAVEGMRALIEMGHTVAVLSNTRDPQGIREWLKRHELPDIPVYAVLGPHPHDHKLTLNFDVFIDDNPEMIPHVRFGQTLLLFDQPWNRGVLSTFHVERVRGWRDVVDYYDRGLECP